MISFNQILPELYVGSFPETSADIEALKIRCSITAVLNLQSDEDLRERGLAWPILAGYYRARGIEVRRFAMRDGDPEDQRLKLPDAVHTLATLLSSGHTVYLHCNAGLGRSPLVAMAYLHWYRGRPLAEAVEHVRERRPGCVPYVHLLLDGRKGP
ncbi:MAG: dual specificity protein phosphatase family protein [candidate division NC10 bacterium]|nr:dual specificity protein phosphatase family protein [candidate division NC10 bacterium]